MVSDELDKKARRNAYLAEWRAKNRDKTRAAQRRYYAANKEVCDERSKACQRASREYYSSKTVAWQRENRDRYLEIRRTSYRRNREEEIFRVRRRAGRIKHGKLWTTPAEQAEIDGMYLFTECFPWFEIDHIVPLNGEMVSGLHVLGNLQVLTRTENRVKGNKFCPAVVELVQATRN